MQFHERDLYITNVLNRRGVKFGDHTLINIARLNILLMTGIYRLTLNEMGYETSSFQFIFKRIIQ